MQFRGNALSCLHRFTFDDFSDYGDLLRYVGIRILYRVNQHAEYFLGNPCAILAECCQTWGNNLAHKCSVISNQGNIFRHLDALRMQPRHRAHSLRYTASAFSPCSRTNGNFPLDRTWVTTRLISASD